jgi:geranylgeranyl pyrophosphate synthase
VECFHKASLIHDDIEDGDTVRDNFPTMHAERGVPVSLNVGDFLIGEGYRLLASAAVPPAQVARMLAAAADAQRTLCLGQGEELCWMKNPSPLSPSRVLEIFRMKTEPAFEVALSLGALAQGAGDQTCSVLARYSRALGVAYQIRDDLLDFDSDLSAAGAAKPSLLAALVWESADPSLRARIDAAWRSGPGTVGAIVREAAAGSDVEARARELLEHYRCEAIRSLGSLRNVRLKSVLQQIIVRILR